MFTNYPSIKWLLTTLVLFISPRCYGASDITNQVFGGVKEGIVAAFGDFNSDELTDVFLIRDNMKVLQILYGKRNSYSNCIHSY